jgi:3-oxoacyl-(acyl-carrier-protein) synthase
MSATNNQVLVTGMGGICALGKGSQSIFNAALSGQSQFSPVPDSILKWLPQAFCAKISTDDFLTELETAEQSLDRAAQLALVATAEALQDAALKNAFPEVNRTGVFCGVGMGGAAVLDASYTKFFETITKAPGRNPTVVHPLSVPRLMPNASAAAISMKYGLTGTTNTYSIACSSSATAIGEAYRHIKHGYADIIVVVGTEAMLTPGSFIAWNALRVLAKPHASGMAASCRPFSASRSGFVLGEGAVCLVLESEQSATRRNAKRYASLAGYGSTSDAQHLTAPSVQGQTRAMQAALDEARLQPSDIGYLNAHGTATDVGDITEAASIHQVFGAATSDLPVSSTKSLHGHLIGAGGALELMLAIQSLNTGSIAPTAYLDDIDPQCAALHHVAMTARHGVKLKAVMSNSFAFGGTNVSLIAKAC